MLFVCFSDPSPLSSSNNNAKSIYIIQQSLLNDRKKRHHTYKINCVPKKMF